MALPLVFLALGSNLGQRQETLEKALVALLARGLDLCRRSSLYLTEPVGGPPQDWYLNMAVEGTTGLEPEALLALCSGVEQEFGRTRDVPEGPRTLDIDILFYGEERRCSRDLVLPHPRLHLRRFVLVPLAEIAPELRHPVLGLTSQQMLERCPDRSRVLLHAPAAVVSE